MRSRQVVKATSNRQFSSAAPRCRIQLAYQLHKSRESTDGSPIVFMHGLFGSKQNSRSISKALVRDLRRSIYAIDLRNHGESPHASQHDYISMSEDVEAFIGENGLEKPILIGHSMGAKVAMTMALRNQGPVSAVVSVDNAPIDAALKTDFGKYLKGMRAVEDAKVDKQSDADAILQKYEEALPFRIPLTTLAKALDHLGDFPFKDPDQARYEGPTLFVRGTKSHYIADEALPVLGRFFPRFELLDVDSGHWVISEKPEEFLRGVVDFIQRTVAA